MTELNYRGGGPFDVLYDAVADTSQGPGDGEEPIVSIPSDPT